MNLKTEKIKARMERAADRFSAIAIPQKWMAFALCAILALAIIPLIAISFYCFPISDDFANSIGTHAAWEQTGSVIRVLQAAFERVQDCYMTWQGTYSAVFLYAIQPAAFGVELYFLSTFILLFGLIASSFYFFYALLVQRLKTSVSLYLIVTSTVLLLQILFIPSAGEAFYWFNGAMFYTFFYSVLLVLLGALLRYPLSKKKSVVRSILIALLCLFIGGGNYTTVLLACCFTFLFAVAYSKTPGVRVTMWVSFACCMAGLIISAAAPGTAIRQSHFSQPSAIKAILLSIRESIEFAGKWTTPVFLTALLFFVPYFWTSAPKSGLTFRYPVLVLGASLCVFAAQLTPPIYAMSGYGSIRQVNHYYYVFIVLCVLNLFYLIGWIRRRMALRAPQGAKEETPGRPFRLPIVWGIVILILLYCSILNVGGIYQNSTMQAAISIASDEAKQYAATMRERYAILEDDAVRDAVVPEIESTPSVFKKDKLASDAEGDIAKDMARYFGKDTVRTAGD